MDMTPMIDCVFQLIIFFVVTITVDQKLNEDIKLEFSKNGPVNEHEDPRTTVIEVDKRGWISMHGTPLTKATLRDLLQSKYRRLGGAYPILIRGDYRTKHQDIRAVMDICTAINIWKIEFAAIKEKKN
jgi:biopolymer transport protein ExbD